MGELDGIDGIWVSTCSDFMAIFLWWTACELETMAPLWLARSLMMMLCELTNSVNHWIPNASSPAGCGVMGWRFLGCAIDRPGHMFSLAANFCYIQLHPITGYPVPRTYTSPQILSTVDWTDEIYTFKITKNPHRISRQILLLVQMDFEPFLW